jgi:hypothetical protein
MTFQFLITSLRLLETMPTMEKHLQLEGARGLLEVLSEVLAMLKSMEDSSFRITSGLTKNLKVKSVLKLLIEHFLVTSLFHKPNKF